MIKEIFTIGDWQRHVISTVVSTGSRFTTINARFPSWCPSVYQFDDINNQITKLEFPYNKMPFFIIYDRCVTVVLLRDTVS